MAFSWRSLSVVLFGVELVMIETLHPCQNENAKSIKLELWESIVLDSK
jgi:hypothetical protein